VVEKPDLDDKQVIGFLLETLTVNQEKFRVAGLPWGTWGEWRKWSVGLSIGTIMRAEQLGLKRFRFFLIRKPNGTLISAGERLNLKSYAFKPILKAISIGTLDNWLESLLALSRFHKQQFQNIYWHVPLIAEFEDAMKRKLKRKCKKVDEHSNVWGLWKIKI
jgi:hypothetical protein